MAEPMKEKEEIQEEAQEAVESVVETVEEAKEEAKEEVVIEEPKMEKTEETVVEENPINREGTGMTDGNSFVTKVEGFIMFFVTLFMLILCTLTLNSTFTKMSESQLEEIAKMQHTITELELQVSALEAELNDMKPESFDVNINVGEESVTMAYDTDENAMIPTDGDVVVEDDAEVSKEFDTRPFLGVAFSTEESTNPFGLKIDYVYEYSPAEEAGLKAGDIIISINGMKINTFDELDSIISALAAGNEIKMEIATATENGIECIEKTAILSYRGNFDLED